MSDEQLQEMLRLHELRLQGHPDGVRANLSGANLRGADLSEANLRGADLRWANLGEANLPEANLRGADLSGANLSGADLSGADLSKANLRGANLSGADLSGADLRGADLRGADLSGVNISCTEVLGFYLGRHFGFAHFGEQYEEGSYVKIGCAGNSLEWWLNNYKRAGEEEDYSKELIDLYGEQLKLIAKHKGVKK
jgi:hypothetical protein